MGRSIRTAAATAAAVITFCSLTVAVRGGEGDRSRPVSLPGTEVRSIASTFVDQEFKLHVYLPPGYDDSGRVYPVVYLTDSDAYFGFFKNMVGSMQFGNLVPEVVVVGIAYEEDTRSYLTKRERDLLPSGIDGRPGSGKAAAFLGFMREELFPFVESRYSVDPGDRTVVGMSAGATFASYVLCTAPELFKRYVIVSPYFIYGQEAVLELEEVYAAGHDSLNVRVYTAMGELEPDYARGPWNALVKSIRSRSYRGLEIEQELLEGLSHMDVVFTAYVNGMKNVFTGRSKILNAVSGNFEAFTGRYEHGLKNLGFIIRLEGGRLFISGSGEYWDELVPVSKTRFGIIENPEVQFSFAAAQNGEVAGMIIHQLGMEIPVDKKE